MFAPDIERKIINNKYCYPCKWCGDYSPYNECDYHRKLRETLNNPTQAAIAKRMMGII